jgi:hypothetical protein
MVLDAHFSPLLLHHQSAFSRFQPENTGGASNYLLPFCLPADCNPFKIFISKPN